MNLHFLEYKILDQITTQDQRLWYIINGNCNEKALKTY